MSNHSRTKAAEAFRFPDTNVFIECTFFKDVNWAKELGLKQVCLVVAPKVLDELDRMKTDPSNRRRRERSRAVLRTLEGLGDAAFNYPGTTLRRGVQLWLLISAPDVQQFPGLDPNRGDDCIIASVLNFVDQFPNTALVTFDTGIRIRARQRGLVAVAVPEHLVLEAEPDPQTIEINQLKRELGEIRAAQPRLRLDIEEDGQSGQVIRAVFREVRLPTQAELDKRVDAEREKHRYRPRRPEARGGFLTAASMFNMISRESTEAYDRKLAAYLQRFAQYLLDLWGWESERARTLLVTPTIHNGGRAGAHNVAVNITFPEGFVVRDATDVPDRPRTPSPPAYPQPAWTIDLHHIPGLRPDHGIDPQLFERLAQRSELEPHCEGRTLRYEIASVVHDVPKTLDPFAVTVPKGWGEKTDRGSG